MGFETLAADLANRRAQHLYRERRLLESPQRVEAVVDGRSVLAFCSNDYLGLAHHPEVAEALIQSVQKYGVGGGASHLVNGHHLEHHRLEEALAEFTGRERALLFSTGYMANLGVVAALLGKNDVVLEDRLNHASLLDAGLLSGARFQRYLHNDMESLAKRLSQSQGERTLVVCDGVFSMDGDIADLPKIAELAKAHNAWVMVDDAHGFGVLGEQGGGCLEHFGLGQEDIPVVVGTLGKAFGTAGAFVAGSEALIETLVQHARTYIYTTAMPPALAAATRTSLRIVQTESWRREHLCRLVQRFRNEAEALGYTLLDSATPIQPIMIGSSEQALALSTYLESQGLLITAIRPPTVPAGTARLRVTFSAEHSEQHLDRLLDALARAKQLGLVD